MKVAAIVPAYNEEITIGAVVDVLRKMETIDEVVVVSDGSVDATARIARQRGVKVVELKTNLGKGGAMKKGIAATDAGLLLFLDADLIGLTAEHVGSLMCPVLSGEALMSIGVFDGGRIATDIAQAITPFLSGQRAVCRWVVDEISDLDVARFGVEVALTRHVKENAYPCAHVCLNGLTHRTKEEKLGLRKGLMARLRMYWEIVRNVQKG